MHKHWGLHRLLCQHQMCHYSPVLCAVFTALQASKDKGGPIFSLSMITFTDPQLHMTQFLGREHTDTLRLNIG